MATLAAPGVSATARSRADVTDHDLVQAVRAGDDHAFERLYHRYHRRISAYIFGMVHDHGRAEDLTQEVFVSALRRMRQTDRPIAFKPWIYEIAKNACIDAFRRSKRAEEVSYDAEAPLAAADQGRLASTGPSPDVAVANKQSLESLCGAFGGLSDAHHQILVMRELEGLSYREIGERLGMSRPSVESTLFRARRRLTEEYEELVTGERCLRIQAIIAQAGGSALGARDQRRVGSHISYCQPCRRHARLAGLDAAAIARRPVRAKIAALLPLPGFFRRRWLPGGGDGAATAASQHAPALAQWSAAASQLGEPSMAGWMKAGVVVAAVAVAGVGAGTAVTKQSGKHDPPVVKSTKAAAHRSPSGSTGHSGATARGAGAVTGVNRTASSTGSGTRDKSTATKGAQDTSGATAGGGATSSSSGTAKQVSSTASGTLSGATGGAADHTPVDDQTAPLKQVTGGAGGSAGSQPLVDPDASQLVQPPASAPASSQSPPSTLTDAVNGAVNSTTDTVSGAANATGGTVGGAAGDAVKGAGTKAADTVGQTTSTAGTILGGK